MKTLTIEKVIELALEYAEQKLETGKLFKCGDLDEEGESLITDALIKKYPGYL